jgi:hypothetical protein
MKTNTLFLLFNNLINEYRSLDWDSNLRPLAYGNTANNDANH